MAFDNNSIIFGEVGLQGENLTNPTALEFSKTGSPTLFVTQQSAEIWRYELASEADGPDGDTLPQFKVTSATKINDIALDTQNYNDGGALGLDANLGFSPSFGFGLKNGSEGGAGNLKRGDSITWTLNEQAGVPQRLKKAAFTVDRDGSTEEAFDFDGNMVRSGSYEIAQTAANADAALRLAVNGGDAIAIDFDASILTVYGVARTGAAIDTFFAHYAASPQNVLTIGGISAAGFSVKDLILDRVGFDGPPVNTEIGDVAENLTPTAMVLTAVSADPLPENADTTAPIKVADIAVTGDGLELNALSLSGEDANLFEIVGTEGTLELRLIVGAALDFETNPTLDVTVAVDDDTAVGVNLDAPETPAPFSLLHIEGPTKMSNTVIKNGLCIETFNDFVL